MPDYFDRHYPYRHRVDEERYSFAINEALDLLSQHRNSDRPNYDRDHKGVPFYIMGYAAFASHCGFRRSRPGIPR